MYLLDPKCMINYNEGLLGVDNRIRLIFYYNPKKSNVEWVIKLPAIMRFVVEEISVLDNLLIVYPYWSNTLYCYDLLSKRWKNVKLTEGDSYLYAHYIGARNGSAYFFDTSRANIIEIVKDDFSIVKHSLPNRLLHNINGNDIKLYENYILFPVVNEDIVYVYNIVDNKSYHIKIGEKEKGYSTVAIEQGKMLLTGHNDSLICYDFSGMNLIYEEKLPDGLKVYSQENGWKEKFLNALPFVKSAVKGNEVWLFPLFTNMLCRFDINTRKFFCQECKDVPVDKGFKPYDFLCIFDNVVYLRDFNGVIYQHDGQEMSEVNMRLPVKYLMSAMNSFIPNEEWISLDEFIKSL